MVPSIFSDVSSSWGALLFRNPESLAAARLVCASVFFCSSSIPFFASSAFAGAVSESRRDHNERPRFFADSHTGRYRRRGRCA